MDISRNIDNLRDRTCECGGKIFTHALALKEVPSLYSPSGKYETIMSHIGFVCIGCGKRMSLRPEVEEKEKSMLTLVKGN